MEKFLKILEIFKSSAKPSFAASIPTADHEFLSHLSPQFSYLNNHP